MARTNETIAPIADALADLGMRRALERADVASWTKDLARASDAVAELAEELRRQARRGEPTGTAGESLGPRSLREADGWVRRAMGEDGASGEARRELTLHSPPRWRSLLGLAFGEGGTVGALNLEQLEEVATRLAAMARTVPAWEHLMTGRLVAEAYGGRGRKPDIAARSILAACEARSFPVRQAAEAAYELGIERVDVGDTGADPVDRIADRWGKKK